MKQTITSKQEILFDLKRRVDDKILEQSNYDLLKKLIDNADTLDEAIKIAELGTTYKRTGFHFDKRLERQTYTIAYFKKNDELSFVGQADPAPTVFSQDQPTLTHKLIIGDNYQALLNLLIEYKGKIDVIYIDPPYGKDSMGEFAQTNYDNAITRDNLLSMLYPRLYVAKQLLSDSGVIFCSIDDRNQAYVKCLFDEVFEERNFKYDLSVVNNLNGNDNSSGMMETQESCLIYAKNKDAFVMGVLPIDNEDSDDWQMDEIGYWKEGGSLKATGINAPREARPNLFFPIWIDKETLEWTLEEPAGVGYYHLIPLTDGKEMSWYWSKAKFIRDRNEVIVKKVSNGYSLYKKQRPALGDLPSKRGKTTFYSPNYATANGNGELKSIFKDKVFDYPKSVALIKDLISLGSHDGNSIILDFFAGSGTTGQAVLELNKEDGGQRQFILCTNDEETETNPNGVVHDVTSKRLKRVMTGTCYDGTSDFEWIKKNKPLGGNLDVYDIAEVSNFEATEGKTPFDVIDETLYGQEKFTTVKEKVEWVCDNFEVTQKRVATDEEWEERQEKKGRKTWG